MPVLTVVQVEAGISAAYGRYLTGTTGTVSVDVGGGTFVNITGVISGTRYNCGFAGGYTMDANSVGTLRAWCVNHPGPDAGSAANWGFGFRERDYNHQDSVNVTLINRTELMFNFHVFLS